MCLRPYFVTIQRMCETKEDFAMRAGLEILHRAARLQKHCGGDGRGKNYKDVIDLNLAEKIMDTKVWNWLLFIEKVLMIISSVGVVLILTAVVVCRQVLSISFIGYTELLTLLAFWMYFIGGAYASFENSHIGADIVGQFASAKTKLMLDIFSRIVQIIVGIPLVILGVDMLKFDILTQQVTVDLKLPLLWSQTPILIGFALMTFYAVVYIIRDYYLLKEHKY